MAKVKSDAPTVDSVEDEILEEIATEDAVKEETPAPRKSRFASLVEEALEDYEPAEPYPFDADPDNIVWITRPDSAERALALASIIDTAGNVDLDRMQPMLYSLLGSAFTPVWDVVRHMPVEVTIALVQDIQDYFFPSISAAEAKNLPGGSAGSSS